MSRSSIVSLKEENTEDYHSIDRLSYSRLVQFDNNRLDYYMERVLKDEEYIEKKRKSQKDNHSLKMGSLIDILRTNEEEYYKLYHESPDITEPAPQMKKFCEFLLEESKKSENFKVNLENAYEKLKESNGGKLGTGFPKFVENFSKDGQNYYDELIASDGKIVITKEDYDKAKKAATKCSISKAFKDEGEVITKLVILFDYDEEEFKCEIDKINIDHNKKIIYLFDYKTGYDIENFIFGSFLLRKYYIQSSLYKFALQRWATENYPGYRIENMQFRCIDPSGSLDPLVYKTSDKMYEQGFNGFYVGNKWYKGVDQILKELKFAVENDMWGMNFDNYENDGIIMIPDFGKDDK